MSISSKFEFDQKALHFLEQLWNDLQLAQFQVEDHWNIDHLCYRVESAELYQELKPVFASFANLLVESEVNGRPIATYKLHTPIFFKHWQISVVELPAPKKGKSISTGFEHIEIVSDESFEKLQRKYSHLTLDLGGLKKTFNPELEVQLGARNLKFHPLSLESVVRLESNQKIWRALTESEVLVKLKEYQPLVAGTFPLGIETEESDLDILVQANDLDELSAKAQNLWSQYESFEHSRQDVDGLESLIVHFKFQGIPFEIFAQNRAAIEQSAYRHFQIEEKILDLGGQAFREKILSLRRTQNLKTEPAFAQALGLAGDPYQALLGLQRQSLTSLRSLVYACLS